MYHHDMLDSFLREGDIEIIEQPEKRARKSVSDDEEDGDFIPSQSQDSEDETQEKHITRKVPSKLVVDSLETENGTKQKKDKIDPYPCFIKGCDGRKYNPTDRFWKSIDEEAQARACMKCQGTLIKRRKDQDILSTTCGLCHGENKSIRAPLHNYCADCHEMCAEQKRIWESLPGQTKQKFAFANEKIPNSTDGQATISPSTNPQSTTSHIPTAPTAKRRRLSPTSAVLTSPTSSTFRVNSESTPRFTTVRSIPELITTSHASTTQSTDPNRPLSEIKVPPPKSLAMTNLPTNHTNQSLAANISPGNISKRPPKHLPIKSSTTLSLTTTSSLSTNTSLSTDVPTISFAKRLLANQPPTDLTTPNTTPEPKNQQIADSQNSAQPNSVSPKNNAKIPPAQAPKISTPKDPLGFTSPNKNPNFGSTKSDTSDLQAYGIDSLSTIIRKKQKLMEEECDILTKIHKEWQEDKAMKIKYQKEVHMLRKERQEAKEKAHAEISKINTDWENKLKAAEESAAMKVHEELEQMKQKYSATQKLLQDLEKATKKSTSELTVHYLLTTNKEIKQEDEKYLGKRTAELKDIFCSLGTALRNCQQLKDVPRPRFTYTNAQKRCQKAEELFRNRNIREENMRELPAKLRNVVREFLHDPENLSQGLIKKYFKANVEETDEREALRGQIGLFAFEDLPENTFLGYYNGKYWDEIEYTTYFSTNYLMHSVFFETYTFGLKDDGNLLISAAEFGNEMRWINDPHIDPMNTYDGKKVVADANVKFTDVVFEGWHYIVAYTTKFVKSREELLANYGTTYWNTIKRVQAEYEGFRKIVEPYSRASKIVQKNNSIVQ